MTTGRINQVTTMPTAQARHDCVLAPERFPAAGVRYKALKASINLTGHDVATAFRRSVLAVKQASPRSPCFPISQVSDQLSQSIGLRSRPSVRTTSNRQHLKGTHSRGVSPSG